MSLHDRIRDALAVGPMTNAELQEVTGESGGYVSRACHLLMTRGEAVNTNPGAGKVALYRLATDDSPRSPGPTSRGYVSRRNGAHAFTGDVPIDRYIERDPCFCCGVRSDIGCKHTRRIAA